MRDGISIVERLVNISPLPTTLAPRVAFGPLT